VASAEWLVAGGEGQEASPPLPKARLDESDEAW
jgi:hypothetical protein